jgi:hypothetical protein
LTGALARLQAAVSELAILAHDYRHAAGEAGRLGTI